MNSTEGYEKVGRKYVKDLKTSSSCAFPPCPKCSTGFLVPLSNPRGNRIVFSFWKCINSDCGHMIGS